MGIVHHANYLTYAELGRIEYLARRGADYRTLIEQGVHLPVVSASLNYKKPARFNDRLWVAVRLSLLTRVKVDFSFQILRERELLCTGSTLLACVDDSGRPRPLSERLRALVLSPESNSSQLPTAMKELSGE